MREEVAGYLAQIHNIFKRYELTDPIKDGEYLKKFADEIGHLRPCFNKDGEVDFQEEDILYIVRETRFSIANTILFAEAGLTTFEISHTKYGPVGHFFGTQVDSRFFYFVDDVFMRLYNFWNRVANFLNIFFEIETNQEKVYFASLIDRLEAIKRTDPNFKKLKEFRDCDFKAIINRKRRTIVHRKCSSFMYFQSFIKNVQKPNELSKLQQERDELLGFFLASYRRMFQGIDEMLDLIRENIKCETKPRKI
jgi:hypothetical protein